MSDATRTPSSWLHPYYRAVSPPSDEDLSYPIRSEEGFIDEIEESNSGLGNVSDSSIGVFGVFRNVGIALPSERITESAGGITGGVRATTTITGTGDIDNRFQPRDFLDDATGSTVSLGLPANINIGDYYLGPGLDRLVQVLAVHDPNSRRRTLSMSEVLKTPSFWCHRCHITIPPSSDEDCICPICNEGGFVEETEETNSALSCTEDASSNDDFLTDVSLCHKRADLPTTLSIWCHECQRTVLRRSCEDYSCTFCHKGSNEEGEGEGEESNSGSEKEDASPFPDLRRNRRNLRGRRTASFWCHQCHRTVFPSLSEDYTCPICYHGCIEEIEDSKLGLEAEALSPIDDVLRDVRNFMILQNT